METGIVPSFLLLCRREGRTCHLSTKITKHMLAMGQQSLGHLSCCGFPLFQADLIRMNAAESILHALVVYQLLNMP